MTHPSKVKGNNFEREIVKLAREAGFPAERAYASNGKSLGHAEEVDLTVADVRVQAKRRKKIPAYLQIPAGADAVVFRQDRGEPLIMLPFKDWLESLSERAMVYRGDE